MSSFQKLWETMQAAKEPALPQDDKAMSSIRTGIGVRENFWEDFLLVINNSEGLSQLLDIPETKISSWHEKINHALEKVKKADQIPDVKDHGKLIKTGQPEGPDPHSIVMNQI